MNRALIFWAVLVVSVVAATMCGAWIGMLIVFAQLSALLGTTYSFL